MKSHDAASAARSIPTWAIIFGIGATLLLAIGAAVSILAPQRLAPPGTEMNAAVHIYAGYTFSRNLSLLIVVLVALVKRYRSVFSTAMFIFSLVNLFDAVMDVLEARYPIVVIALLLSLGAALAARSTAGPAGPHNSPGL